MSRFFQISTLTLVLTVLVAYLGDAILLQVKVHHGTAYSVVEVDQVLVTPLKGQKEEYDLAGRASVACVRSVFHQLGCSPCWWLQRRNPQPK